MIPHVGKMLTGILEAETTAATFENWGKLCRNSNTHHIVCFTRAASCLGYADTRTLKTKWKLLAMVSRREVSIDTTSSVLLKVFLLHLWTRNVWKSTVVFVCRTGRMYCFYTFIAVVHLFVNPSLYAFVTEWNHKTLKESGIDTLLSSE